MNEHRDQLTKDVGHFFQDLRLVAGMPGEFHEDYSRRVREKRQSYGLPLWWAIEAHSSKIEHADPSRSAQEPMAD